MKPLRAFSTRSFAAAALLAISACSSTSDRSTVDPRVSVDGGNCGSAVAEKGDIRPVMRLEVGGSLEIADASNTELSVTRPVDADGTVFLPELGAVLLVGLTRTEIESLLSEKYAHYYEHTSIKVRIQQPAKKYFIFGEVGSEGEQPFNGDMTIFEAVTKAQPRKDSANLGRVRLIRADPNNPYQTTVDLEHLIQTGDSTFNVHVQERDVIYVPAVEPKR